MDKNDFIRYGTPYQKYIKSLFLDTIPDNDVGENYKAFMDFDFILTFPYYYEVEEEMLEYAKKHPNADIAELYQHFTFLVPPGTLPPDADEWDDEEDDD